MVGTPRLRLRTGFALHLQIGLEFFGVLAQIVPKPDQMAPVIGTERTSEFCRETGSPQKVIAQQFPTAFVRRRPGMRIV
jgi:hypothetical protein